MEKYLVRYPSRSFTLRNLGANLWMFMDREYRGSGRGVVLDVIRFEWAKIEAFDRPMNPLFDPARLTDRQKRRLDQMRFRFQPHVRVLDLEYPVYEIVDRMVRGGRRAVRRVIPRKRRSYTVVYRSDGRVYHKEIDPIFYRMVMGLQRGWTLSQVCAGISRRIGSAKVDSIQRRVQEWFQGAVANHWFCDPKGVKRHERDRADVPIRGEFSLQNRLVAAPDGAARRRARVFSIRQGQDIGSG